MTDYAELIERLDHRASTMNGAEPIGSGDGHTYVIGYYTVSDRMLDREAANALSTLLESNKALVRERTNLIETKREQIGRLNTRIAALERERDQLLDKLHCMCGSPIDHSAWEGHTPVSVYDYSLDQERSRAEDAEARLAEALKALAEVRRRARNIWGACSSDQIIDKDVERQAKLMLEYIDAACACLDKKEKSND